MGYVFLVPQKSIRSLKNVIFGSFPVKFPTKKFFFAQILLH